ncbi:MAG: metallophosphoesterase family protein [Planctomycetota bacterium]|nr:metallophosphoesterase family protein [Planctomycetota bacterium]
MKSPPSSEPRLLAIGDLHGHLDPLNALLDLIQPCSDDQLVFLGDYIDRGPDSFGVIDRLLQVQREFPNTIFLRGNHEQWLLNWLFSQDDTFLYLGGRQTMASYADASKALLEDDVSSPEKFLEMCPESHLRFVTETRLFYECEDCIFVHGGLDPSIKSLDRQRAHDLLLGHRDFFGAVEYPKKVVVGHTSTQIFRSLRPVLQTNGIIMVDTSYERTGLLSAVNPRSGEIFQVQVTG